MHAVGCLSSIRAILPRVSISATCYNIYIASNHFRVDCDYQKQI